jgi:cobalt-zinc-cadmium efflux system outer membrane protein
VIRGVATFLLIVSASALAGCASVPREAGFGDVEKVVADRSGKRVHWDQGTPADAEVADVVRSMLRKELNADEAVQIALLKNQNLQATYEELGIAQAELVEAGLLKNPTLSAEVRFPGRPKLPLEIDVTQEFLDLLFLPLRKRAAEAAFEATKLRVTHEVLDTAAEVKAAFYRAQGAEQLVEMRRTITQATEASYEAARRLHEAGNITDLAFAQERAMYEQSKIELAKAEAEALDVREELNALMGIWGTDTGWMVPPRLPELPQAEVDPNGLESLAVSQRLDLAAARQEIQRLAQTLGVTQYTALVPEVNVTAHYEREPDGANTVGPGVELPLPIFNQGQPAVAAAKARLRQSQRRYAALAVEVRAQVRRARNRLLAARDRANYYSRIVIPVRHQIVQQTQLQYNAMLVGIFQLLESKKDEIEAGREYVEALTEYWVARAELERAVSGRLRVAMPSTRATPPPATTQPSGSEGHKHHQH